MKNASIVLLLLLMVCASLVSGCGGGSGGGGSNAAGTVSVGLTDATSPDYMAVYITVKEVWVSKTIDNDTQDSEDAGQWAIIAAPNMTTNLLELVNGVIQHLGLASLQAGRYNEMRLILGDQPDTTLNLVGEPHPYANYFIRGNEALFESIALHAPSGSRTGFKIVGGFTVEPEGNTDLVLDFNVAKSIVQAGKSGKWLLKPTVKVLDQDTFATITGLVYHEDAGAGAIPLEGALVSAQIASDGNHTERVMAATLTDDQGRYTLLLEAGTYQVVAIMQGYATAAAQITVASGANAQQDFALTKAEGMGTIHGAVDVVRGEDEQFVSINILAKDDEGNKVQVASKSVADGGAYWFDLPTGRYSMVAVFVCNGEEMTLEANDSFEITDGGVIRFDIVFENQDEDPEDSQKPDKVRICHKGREITISASALQAHLNHGDAMGSCGDDDEDDSDRDSGGKVVICHKGRTLNVEQASLEAHLKHGDTIGPCGGTSGR